MSYHINAVPQTFRGVKVIQSSEAYEMVKRFPDKKWSKRRNRRVIGKHGSLHRIKPLAYKRRLYI